MKEYFDFLDDMQESGATNMFMAPMLLKDAFDLDRQEAVKIFTAWTKQRR